MATVLITGCRRGIGLDVATRLFERGHTVWATVHRHESVAPLRDILKPYGKLVCIEKLDILNQGDIARAAHWNIDVLINNAALSEGGPLMELDLRHVRRVFETNVLGTLALTQAIVPGMIARGHGRVVIIGSQLGILPTPFRAAYGISKWALQDVAHSLRIELGPFGIDVNLVNPGAFATGFNAESAARAFTRMPVDSSYRARMETVEYFIGLIEAKDTGSIAKHIVNIIDRGKP